MELGSIEFNWTMIFQLLNTVLWIGIIYFILKLMIKLPKRIKKNEDEIERIANILEETNKKLD